MEKLTSDNEIILNKLEAQTNDPWKTLQEIEHLTEIERQKVSEIISSSSDIVQSTRYRKNGEEVFASKNVFRANTSFWNKMIGAFKNRID